MLKSRFAVAAAALLAFTALTPAAMARTVLSGNLTVHVETTGSDGVGADGTVAHPYLTGQHAYETTVNNTDNAGYNVTIQYGTGSWTGATAINFDNGWTGGGSYTVSGTNGVDGSGHYDTKLTCPVRCFEFSQALPGDVSIQYFKMDQSGAGDIDGIYIVAPNVIFFGNIEIGTLGSTVARGIVTDLGGTSAIQNGTVYVVGQTTQVFLASANSVIQTSGGTVKVQASTTNTGSPPSGTEMYYASEGGVVQAVGVTYSGNFSNHSSAYKYAALTNGVVDFGGGSTSSVPGDLTFTSTGGQVN